MKYSTSGALVSESVIYEVLNLEWSAAAGTTGVSSCPSIREPVSVRPVRQLEAGRGCWFRSSAHRTIMVL